MSSLIDWRLAERIAHIAAGEGPAAMFGDVDLDGAGVRSRDAVLAYTALAPSEPIPDGEWVSRREWAQINLASIRVLLAPLEERVRETLPPGAAGAGLARLSGRILALQVGGLLGLASRRVLGQYEFPLLGGAHAPRLIFVGENIDVAARELDAEPGEVLEWIALHEVTHAVHFSSAPWLREHIGDLAERLLRETPLKLSAGDLLAGGRRLASSDPRELLARLRESDPVTLLAPAASRATIGSVQSTMALVEGYAEHVMDAAAGHLGPVVGDLRAGLERRRDGRSSLARVLSWLLGFELKLRQYRDGKRFVDAVVTSGGIGTLNRAWEGPAALPSLAELADADGWIERVTATAT